MLYGIIADIHGNLEALSAVQAFLAERGVERLLCLGDIVGYNADSDVCVRLLARPPTLAIAGNHDLIAIDRIGVERCGTKATFALQRTRVALSSDSKRALALLPRRRLIEGEIVLIHGGVVDPCQYMVSPAHIEANALLLREREPSGRICFFGHTHVQALYEVEAGVATPRPTGERISLGHGRRCFFINPGSVDAARRREKLAELAVFDSSRQEISFHRVPYEHERAERRAAEEGYRMTWLDKRFAAARTALAQLRPRWR
ncbi:metallophosphoesterase family protein [Sorangium sp. So ce327]|jgi:predicted phosphodiesterase|uniref:metallophosphoesterase family protein n=1 Tax=unclassified Sorangium TaxID=2621164 RepID=UPI003F5FDE5F